MNAGPLAGTRVLEMAGIGPGPFAGMMLADMGADVLRVDRPRRDDRDDWWLRHDILSRGRRSVVVDLKKADGRALVRELAAAADVFLEGFRPGVTERMGLGPDDLLADNPRLVYGRMTGWGQDGPLAPIAGHDIDYVAVTGALDAIGPAGGPPVPPLNLLGDFGGGGMLLAFGVACALLEARSSGQGQVVDAAMVDGVSLLSAWIHTLRNAGSWADARGSNLLDGGAPNYAIYRTADDRHVAVGAMEPQFFGRLLERLELPREWSTLIADRANWPVIRRGLEESFARRTRDEWAALLGDDDVCVAPVLSFADAARHPHVEARRTLVPTTGGYQPAPAPRFSRTPAAQPAAPTTPGQGGESALSDWGVPSARVRKLRSAGVLDAVD